VLHPLQCSRPLLSCGNSLRTLVAPPRIAGDFDASGADIERDGVVSTDCWIHVERVLLTHDQVREYELPSAAWKAGDPHWAGFASRYGLDPGQPVQWELKALDQTELQRLVLDGVAPYIDQAVLRDRIPTEEQQRRQLRPSLSDGPPSAGP
jgi:hypothetical protein